MSKQLEKMQITKTEEKDAQSPLAPATLNPTPSKGGRPRGSTNKITVTSLLDAIERTTGESFEEALVRDWAIAQDNRELRYKYNQLLFGKVMADRHHVEIDETSTVANRQQAFLRALETIGAVAVTVDPKPELPLDD